MITTQSLFDLRTAATKQFGRDAVLSWKISPDEWDCVVQLKDAANRYLLESATMAGFVGTIPDCVAHLIGLPVEIDSAVRGIEIVAVSTRCEYCGRKKDSGESCVSCGAAYPSRYHCAHCGSGKKSRESKCVKCGAG